MDRKLYRSRSQRMVAGVFGGITEYFDMDPTIVRLIAVLLTVVGNGAALIAYIVIWIAVPEAPVEGFASSGYAAPPSATPPTVTPEEVVEPAPAPMAAPAATPVAPTTVETSSGRGTMLFGLALVIVGLVFVAEVFIPGLDIWQLWPLILVGLGLRMIITGKGGD